jgi:6-phosphogluconolactonase
VSLPESRVFEDAGALVTALSDGICAEADRAIEARGVFHLVLAGGSTPIALYRALAARPAGDSRWHIWFGDERCLPPGHAERNNVMAEAAWLAGSAIPPENRLPIPAERGAEAAAADYTATLAAAPIFDLVLLGMGEDGHTASLFPGHELGAAPGSPAVLAVHDAPKPPPDRVSLSAARLSDSRQRVVHHQRRRQVGRRDALEEGVRRCRSRPSADEMKPWPGWISRLGGCRFPGDGLVRPLTWASLLASATSPGASPVFPG